MRMEKLTNVTYGTAGLTAFFASISLYEWGFVIGMGFSMLLGLATYLMTWREQRKRTALFAELVHRNYSSDPRDIEKIVGEMLTKAKKDI
ncbi:MULTISPECIES: hypothetical protein [Proteus]|uniref:hypothetical protein n=1 Tax=Proteus TaxID=583 RepID=UPI00288C6120|nr:hypothetical protein [Proteus penneri]